MSEIVVDCFCSCCCVLQVEGLLLGDNSVSLSLPPHDLNDIASNDISQTPPASLIQ